MKAQYTQVSDLIEARSPIWEERLGLSDFEIEHAFLDAFEGGDDSCTDFYTTATCETRWNYFQAKIKWYLPSAVRIDPQHLEQTLVHELCHVLLASEQADIPDKHSEKMELATERAARAFWNAYKGRKK